MVISSPAIDALRTFSMTLIYILLSPSDRPEQHCDGSGFQIIHRTGHLYRAIRLHFSERGAVLASVAYRDFHILARDSINNRVILRCPFAGVRRRCHCRLNFCQRAREIAEVGVIDKRP